MLVLFIYINSTNIPPIMIINRIYEHQNLLSLLLVSFLVGPRTYQHPCTWGGPVVRPLCTSRRDNRNSEKTQTLICSLSGIRKSDPSVREVEKIAHLNPSGHCDPLLDGLDANKGTLLLMGNMKIVDVLSGQISCINP